AGGFRFPRPADLHDGGSAQHLVLRASAVLLEEHRACRRPRDEHSRDDLLSGDGRQSADRPTEGREFHSHTGARHMMFGSPSAMSEATERVRPMTGTAPRIMIVEDESSLALLLAYN